jgi:hypothetical protein
MARSSPNPWTADFVDRTLAVGAGFWIVTLAVLPPAIAILALTAVAAPFMQLRRLLRRAAVPVRVKEEST